MDESRLHAIVDKDLRDRWKSFVFLSFSPKWNIVIVFQVYFVFIVSTYTLAFSKISQNLIILMYCCDLFYFFDVICVLIHYNTPSIRKMSSNHPRNLYFLTLDILSLLPIEISYMTHVWPETGHSELVFKILMLNRCLRIYRVGMLLRDYDSSILHGSSYACQFIFRYLSYLFLTSHVLSCLWFVVAPAPHCLDNPAHCWFIYEVNNYFLLIHNWAGPSLLITSMRERILAIIVVVAGFVLIYTSCIPAAMHIFMKVYRFKGVHHQKILRLKCFLKNMMLDKRMAERVSEYYNHIWKVGSTYKDDAVIKSLPVALQKDIFTDIYWDALRHSELLRNISRSCKRSLSLVMDTIYCQKDDVVFLTKKKKKHMLYLVQGIIHLMAEENEESAVISFSSGTILGESSLLLQTESSAIVKCGSFCEMQVLKRSNLMRVLTDYPSDRRKVFQNWKRRLVMAKLTQWRKHKLCQERNVSDRNNSGVFTRSEFDSIKWLKEQWRALWEAHERYTDVARLKEEGRRIPSWRRQYQIRTSMEFISNYLDLLVISDSVEMKTDVVCLKTRFPWSMDPESPFLRHWKLFIQVVVLFPALIYPYCIGWHKLLPTWVFNLSVFVTLFFIIDVIIQLSTAEKTKHAVITKFSKIAKNCLQRPLFYFDIAAALPMQLYVSWHANKEEIRTRDIGMYLQVALLKCHRLFYLNGPEVGKTTAGNFLYLVFLLLLFIYWFAEALQLISIRCFITCRIPDWPQLMHLCPSLEYLKAMIWSLICGIGVTADDVYPIQLPSLITMIILKTFFFLFFCLMMGDLYATHTIRMSHELRFLTILDRVERFLSGLYVSKDVKERVMRTIEFQWLYDRGDYIMSKRTITSYASEEMRREIFMNTLWGTFKKCRFFKDESDEFIEDVMSQGFLVAVPAGTTMITHGKLCLVNNVLHRGFCQVSSFLRKDVDKSLAAAVLVKRGSFFPLLTALCNVPSPTVIETITDCEFFVLSFEDFLSMNMKHHVFKDLITTLKENNFRQRLKDCDDALVQANVKFNPPRDEEKEFLEPFNNYKPFWFRRFLLYVFKRKTFSPYSKLIIAWEVIFNAYQLVISFVWPMLFGLLIYHARNTLIVLSVLCFLNIMNIYIRFHVPYYNEKGLLITHPLYTARNYLCSNFIVEFLTILPIYQFYTFVVKDPMKQDNIGMVFFVILKRLLSLVQVVWYLQGKESMSRHWKKPIRTFKRTMIVFGSLNAYINCRMSLAATFNYSEPHVCSSFDLDPNGWLQQSNLVRKNHIIDFYIAYFYWTLMNYSGNPGHYGIVEWHVMVFAYMNNFFGFLLMVIIYCWLAARTYVLDLNVTIYQDRMKSFCAYLESENTDDKIVEAAVAHFEHAWSRTRGENLVETLSRLPKLFYEDLMYPLYFTSLNKIRFLAKANAGFYRALAVRLKREYRPRGSLIIHREEVQTYIYFIHRGKCIVLDWFMTLEKGSMIGDITRSGLMRNNIYALTHVELLRIPSDEFYTILNDFYETEQAFVYSVKKMENFVRSNFKPKKIEVRSVDSRDAMQAFGLRSLELKFEDLSYFDDPYNAMLQDKFSYGDERQSVFIIYPGSFAMTAYQILSLLAAFLTLLLVPMFYPFGTLTSYALTVINALDVLWLLRIITTFRVGVEDPIKGDLITSSKYIALNYLLQADGFIIDVLSVLPFDYFFVMDAGGWGAVDVKLIHYFRSLKFLRGIYLFGYMKVETQKLKVSVFKRLACILVTVVLIFNLVTYLYIWIATDPDILVAMEPFQFEMPQFKALILAVQNVLNIATSSNMVTRRPENLDQAMFYSFLVFWSILGKGIIISRIISILYVINLTRAKYKFQVIRLEKYLQANEVSPAIIDEVLQYKHNLLVSYRSESMPYFLHTAPRILKSAIMKDLYVHRLKNCFIFENAKNTFLSQLVGRMERQIYFAGQKITEKGDVDNSMYFVHKGEVNQMEQTDAVAYVEYVIGILVAGETFGLPQGTWKSRPHRYTYRARTFSEILILNSNDWVDLRLAFPDITEDLMAATKFMAD